MAESQKKYVFDGSKGEDPLEPCLEHKLLSQVQTVTRDI